LRLLRVSVLWATVLVVAACWVASAAPSAAPDVSPEATSQSLLLAAAPPRDLFDLAVAYGRIASGPRLVHANPPTYRAGDVHRFWIGRQNPDEHFEVDAELRVVSRHAYWYVQRGFNASDDALRSSADQFDNTIYPGVRRLVGSEAFPGIDNDPRITIFNGEVPGVNGYQTSADGYPRTVHPYSNEREIVYLNLQALNPGTSRYAGTLAHEFTHLVHQQVNPIEDTWLKEGLADFAAATVLRDRSLLPAGAMLSRPDVQLTGWATGAPGDAPISVHYQAGSWFLQYFADRFGEDALAGVLGRSTHGQRSFDEYFRDIGSSMTFAELFSSWVAANLVGQQGGDQIRPYVSASPGAPSVRRVEASRTFDTVVPQFGTTYYELSGGRAWSLSFEGMTTAGVLGATPIEGEAMWYAGRAEASNASMMRRFDLSSAQSAALSYSIWYDIERDYDYAYVSASTNGETWTLLPASRMVRTDPNGNNLGVGYTGHSGDAGASIWLREQVDLTPYVGGPVWVRFSYVTDDATLYEGIALDDVRLDATGYEDGAESPNDDWQLNGWTRVGPALTQTWALQVIETSSGGARLTRLPVRTDAPVTWSSSSSIDRTVVAISGTAPVTLQPAGYRLSFTSPDAP